MAQNPYAPPRTPVEDPPTSLPDGDFIPEGRGVPAGNGWRWIADAWAFTGEQRWTFVGVFSADRDHAVAANFVPIIGPLAVSLFSPVLLGGFLLGCDAVRRGERLEVGHLFAGFQRHTGKLVGLGALSLAFGILAAIIMVRIVGASFLPLMFGGAEPIPEEVTGHAGAVAAGRARDPGSEPAAVDGDVVRDAADRAAATSGTALKTSFLACLKNILSFLVWSVAILVLGILASIPLFLGWLLLGPVMMVSIYMAYRDIFHET